MADLNDFSVDELAQELANRLAGGRCPVCHMWSLELGEADQYGNRLRCRGCRELAAVCTC